MVYLRVSLVIRLGLNRSHMEISGSNLEEFGSEMYGDIQGPLLGLEILEMLGEEYW